MSEDSLTIRAMGNSAGIVLPQELLDSLNLRQGDKLFVTKIPGGFTLHTQSAISTAQTAAAHQVMETDQAILRKLAK